MIQRELPKFYYIINYSFSFIIFLSIFIFIIHLNSGVFTYTLDDPYIHLAFAQTLAKGTYGINVNEFSSPSSSILWPFLLLPFVSAPFFLYMPLILNLIFAILSLVLLQKILQRSGCTCNYVQLIVISQLIALSINLYGLVFVGMEHSLQVLLVLVILYGSILYLEQRRIRWWWLFSIIIAPLVRYEMLSFSILTCFIVLKDRKFLLFCALQLLILAPAASYSGFLYWNETQFLPNSVFHKMGDATNFIGKFRELLIARKEEGRAVVVLALASFLLIGGFLKKRTALPLSLIAFFATCAHIFFGRWGWFERYEMYLLAYLIPLLFYVYQDFFRSVFQRFRWSPLLVGLFLFLLLPQSFSKIVKTPVAANDIFLQMHQMHRFITKYYPASAGVNDLGYVAFDNPNYVLDYGGLANKEAQDKNIEKSKEWMNRLAQKHDIKIVMIYDRWFLNSIPQEWFKLGELTLQREKVTAADKGVSFYSVKKPNQILMKSLDAFISDLPEGVQFQREKNF